MMSDKEMKMNKDAKRLVACENSIRRMEQKINELYRKLETEKEKLATARRAVRASIEVAKKPSGFSMRRGDVTLNVRARCGRYGGFDAYQGKTRVATDSNMYDMQTDFAMGRLFGFDVK